MAEGLDNAGTAEKAQQQQEQPQENDGEQQPQENAGEGQEQNQENAGGEQGDSNPAKEAMKKAAEKVKEMAKKVAKKAVKAIGHFAKVLMSNPYFWIISAIVLALIVTVTMGIAFVTYLAEKLTNPFGSDGTTSSIAGIDNKDFYGARVMYYDGTSASKEMADVYIDFTVKILKETKDSIPSGEETAKIELVFGLNSDEQIVVKETESQAQFTLPQESPSILSIAIDVASLMVTSPVQSGLPDTYQTLLAYTNASTYMGVYSDFKDDIADKMLQSSKITDNDDNLIKNKIVALLTDEMNNPSDYAYMFNVTEKAYVKDYILSEKETTVSGVPKKNYISYIYMPKTKVVYSTLSFNVIIEDESIVDVAIKRKSGESISNVTQTEQADKTWYVNNVIEKYVDTKAPFQLVESDGFTAIDETDPEYLTEEKSLFTLIRTGKISAFFITTDLDYAKVSTDETDTVSTAYDYLNNTNSDNYVYVEFDSNTETDFAICEQYTNAAKQ